MRPSDINPALIPPGVGPVGPSPAGPAGQPRPQGEGPSFAELLDASKSLQFSKHAAERVNRRQIPMSAQTLQRLSSGVEKAAAKGSRSSAVFVDGTAFVVAVPTKTVVTAVDQEHIRRDGVFTNIDSAVIA